ncbi:VOC family protein [candidate division WOR-3 bacterium]|nr:VOC family protein [candidate division WOR-3 bacterium]
MESKLLEHVKCFLTVLYVSDQKRSAEFYKNIFRKEPDLDVPGMTEFDVFENLRLGIMPNDGIASILKEKTLHPSKGNGIPRCELYLYVEDLEFEYENAKKTGAVEISPIEKRNWGDRTCYFSDPDGHVLAFAEKIHSSKT